MLDIVVVHPAHRKRRPISSVNKNIAASTWLQLIQHLRSDNRLWWGALVTNWFWLAGVVVLSLLPPAVKSLLGGNEETVTAYLAIFSIAALRSGPASAAVAGQRPHHPAADLARRIAARLLRRIFMGYSLYGVTPATQFAGTAGDPSSARHQRLRSH